MELEDFVQRLAQLRQNKGVSARQMSLDIAQNPNYINQIENGKNDLPMSTFLYICDYLGVTPQEFFDLDATDPIKTNELMQAAKCLPTEQLDHLIGIVQSMAQGQKPKKKHP